jgi:hypothetical protein
MADHHGTPTHPKAKKEHRCIYCGGPILVGEQYVQQEGFYDGAPYRNRYHAECYETCADECRYYNEWEFYPYNGEYPERIKAVVDARRAAADAAVLGPNVGEVSHRVAVGLNNGLGPL